MIKAAQRLGFTLREVAELLEAGRHRHGARSSAGLQARASARLAEVEARLADLAVIRDTLSEALGAGCDNLITCAGSTCCPLPFAELATDSQRLEGTTSASGEKRASGAGETPDLHHW